MPTFAQSVCSAVLQASKFNKGVQSPPAAVLWADPERQWEHVIPSLRSLGLPVLTTGAYDPSIQQGPAIWLKCAIAGVIEEIRFDGRPPIVYLPGVSRGDLRAIESCPRDLQPLAELQYRGVFWSQANGKDWTVNAFLTSKNGGLGLDVTQDKSTHEAIARTLEAGVLLEQSVADLQARTINAAWLDGLLAPNPARDLLVWLNEPQGTHAAWVGVRWDLFLKRCKADFSFDPVSGGPLIAAEKLAQRKGAWASVWELYLDSYANFPKVAEMLAKVQPPQRELFDDGAALSGYPRINDDSESALRYKLSACGAMAADQARAAIHGLEKEHSLRRAWVWARMGLAPLAFALQHLAAAAKATEQLPVGSTPDSLAKSYELTGWVADDAAMQALAAVQSKADVDAVGAALRAFYSPWLNETAIRFQDAVKASGRLAAKPSVNAMSTATSGLCTVFVDGLRYDVAVNLKKRVSKLGTSVLTSDWTSMPSVTASGKAWCSPVAHLIAGDKQDQDFEPRVAADGKQLSAYNFRKLLGDQGIQVLDKHELGDPAGRAWVECGDLDHYGHEHGIRLARDIASQLDHIVDRLQELKDAGWRRFRIVTDHGWLLLPGGLPKTELAKHQAETRWGRCAVLKTSAHGTPLTFGWDWCEDVQVAYAPGISSFIAGAEYAHGGLTLQECLVPVIDMAVSDQPKTNVHVTISSVTWKGLRCVVEVSPEVAGLTVDIRTKPVVPASSLVAHAKALEGGKASLAIADDEDMGSAAVIVVLDAGGTVIQKSATTVGG